jgi:hypothetical protein
MRKDPRPNIHLYIDRLILDGLPIDRADAPQLQTAIEVELRRLLSNNGLATELQAGGALPSVRTNGIQLETGNHPAGIGTQIAESIYSGIGKKQ